MSIILERLYASGSLPGMRAPARALADFATPIRAGERTLAQATGLHLRHARSGHQQSPIAGTPAIFQLLPLRSRHVG